MISQKELTELFKYKDGVLYWNVEKSSGAKIGYEVGSIDGCGYLQCTVNGKRHYVHRLIFMYHNGYLPDYIDHINCKKNDNRIENLRSCSRSENNYNQGISRRNKSGLKGVSFDKKNKKWRADIMFNSKRYSLGRFATKEEAYAVACKARDKFHGEFARHE